MISCEVHNTNRGKRRLLADASRVELWLTRCSWRYVPPSLLRPPPTPVLDARRQYLIYTVERLETNASTILKGSPFQRPTDPGFYDTAFVHGNELLAGDLFASGRAGYATPCQPSHLAISLWKRPTHPRLTTTYFKFGEVVQDQDFQIVTSVLNLSTHTQHAEYTGVAVRHRFESGEFYVILDASQMCPTDATAQPMSVIEFNIVSWSAIQAHASLPTGYSEIFLSTDMAQTASPTDPSPSGAGVDALKKFADSTLGYIYKQLQRRVDDAVKEVQQK